MQPKHPIQMTRDLPYTDEDYGSNAPGQMPLSASPDLPYHDIHKAKINAVIGPDPHHQTDKQLKRHISHLLSADYGVDLKKIQLHVHEGAVIIEGVVPENKLAHITQKIGESGAKDIDNRLRAE